MLTQRNEINVNNHGILPLMKISQLVQKLQALQDKEGDIEVTVTGSHLPDGFAASGNVADIFETTAENLVVVEDESRLGKRVRIYL